MLADPVIKGRITLFSKPELIVIALIVNIGLASTYFYWHDSYAFRPGEPSMSALQATETLRVGDPAPDFELKCYPGSSLRLSDLLGKKRVILAFYPNDSDDLSCLELQSLSYALARKHPQDTEVLGISRDPLEHHRQLAKQFDLKQTLLSDEDGAVTFKYGVLDRRKLPRRIIIAINEHGKIESILEGRPGPHDSVELLANP